MTAPTVETDTPVDAERGLPTSWRGPIMPINTPAGDGRVMVLAEGAEPPVRMLPLPLSAQKKLADGHDGSTVIGLLSRVWLGDDGNVWGEGPLDLADPDSAEWARKLGDGFAMWVSADLSSNGALQVEEVPFDKDGNEITTETLAALPPDELPPMPAYTHRRVTNWKVMGATMVSSPAFETARIEPVWDTAPADPALVAAAAELVDEEPSDSRPKPEQPEVTEHTGGMVALIPTEADAKRLAVEGGEPVEELHTTLAYLGEDVRDWTPEQQQAVVDAVTDVRPPPVDGKVFAHARFNPGPDGPDECAVYLAEAQGLTALRASIVAALKDNPDIPITDETDSYDSFVPHVTAGYGLDIGKLAETGPIRYDRLRVALAGKNFDIPLERTTAALTAAGIVYPRSDFDNPQLDQPTSLKVTEDGRVFGHLACWGVCHLGFKGVCITPPASQSDYHYFHRGEISTDEGALEVGKLTLGTGHADTNRRMSAAQVTAHYDNTGTQVAVVRAGEDEFGIWVSGRVLPGVSQDRIDELRRSSISGDWREDRPGGAMELRAILSVNMEGFPIPRAMAASGALVAAGVVHPSRGKPKPKQAVAMSMDDAVELFMAAADKAQEFTDRRAAAESRMAAMRVDIARARMESVDPVNRARMAAASDRMYATRMGAASDRMVRLLDAPGDAPGGRMPPQLKKYWLSGPGLARWATTPTPYRSLVAALTQEIDDMTPAQIKGLAANLYVAHFGRHPGKHNDEKES